ncbi:unnamed protein product, partial [Rhizoctonia solani]
KTRRPFHPRNTTWISVRFNMTTSECPQCRQSQKRPESTFCSMQCRGRAMNQDPSIIYLPAQHVLYADVADKFMREWKPNKGPRPQIRSIYLVTWKKSLCEAFWSYKRGIESQGSFHGRPNKRGIPMSAGNEKKLFCGAQRACRLGEDSNNMRPCTNSMCKLCETLRLGFKPYLDLKRRNHHGGVRLGPAIYSSNTPSK